VQHFICIVLSYLLAIVPACKSRDDDSSQVRSTKTPPKSFDITETQKYATLKQSGQNGLIDKAMSLTESTFRRHRLHLLRVDGSGSRSFASGGIQEMLASQGTGYRYYFVDNMEHPDLVFSVKVRGTTESRFGLQILQHDPENFRIRDYSPMIVDTDERNRDGVRKTHLKNQEALNSFVGKLVHDRTDRIYLTEGVNLAEDETKVMRNTIIGIIGAVVLAGLTWAMVAAMRSHKDGKFNWGLLAVGAIVVVAIIFFIFYSNFDESDVEEVPEGDDPEEIEIPVSAWNFIETTP